MPKITVLLTSYNHANYIKKSIDSILNQTFSDFELIIIDDCSSDNSWEIIKKYKDKRIKKIRNKKNIMHILTRYLVNTFEGKYFAIAHCDDMWESTKLEKQYNYLEKHENIAACFTHVEYIDEEDKEISSQEYSSNFNVENKDRYEWLNYFFYNGNCLCHPSILMRKDTQLNENLFVNGLGSLPDFYRWVKLCLHHEIYVYPEKLTYFRIRKGGANTSGINVKNLNRLYFDELKVLELYRKLSDEEFKKVFPEYKEYTNKNYFNKDYILNRLCIDKLKIRPYRYYGLSNMFDILQNDDVSYNLEKKINYTVKDFISEVEKEDLFNIIDKERILNCKLYFDFGNGFNENDVIQKNIFIDDFKHFSIEFEVNKRVKKIRFDPDENKLRWFNNVKIYVNGQEQQYVCNCSVKKISKEYFYTNDPYYIINVQENVKHVKVIGETSVINNFQIINQISKKKKNKFNFFKYKIIKGINNKNDVLKKFILMVNDYYPIKITDKIDIDNFLEKIDSNGMVCYCRSINKIIGAIFFYANNVENSVAFITLVGVLSKYQDSGIGGKMLIKVINYCKNNGFKKINLYTRAINEKGIDFYENYGFYQISCDRHGDVKMEKSLLEEEEI